MVGGERSARPAALTGWRAGAVSVVAALGLFALAVTWTHFPRLNHTPSVNDALLGDSATGFDVHHLLAIPPRGTQPAASPRLIAAPSGTYVVETDAYTDAARSVVVDYRDDRNYVMVREFVLIKQWTIDRVENGAIHRIASLSETFKPGVPLTLVRTADRIHLRVGDDTTSAELPRGPQGSVGLRWQLPLVAPTYFDVRSRR